MNRESDQHSPREDDVLKKELEAMLRSGAPAHADQWRDQEAPAPDEPGGEV